MAPFLYQKNLLTDYHFGNLSTGFSVEPKNHLLNLVEFLNSLQNKVILTITSPEILFIKFPKFF